MRHLNKTMKFGSKKILYEDACFTQFRTQATESQDDDDCVDTP